MSSTTGKNSTGGAPDGACARCGASTKLFCACCGKRLCSRPCQAAQHAGMASAGRPDTEADGIGRRVSEMSIGLKKTGFDIAIAGGAAPDAVKGLIPEKLQKKKSMAHQLLTCRILVGTARSMFPEQTERMQDDERILKFLFGYLEIAAGKGRNAALLRPRRLIEGLAWVDCPDERFTTSPAEYPLEQIPIAVQAAAMTEYKQSFGHTRGAFETPVEDLLVPEVLAYQPTTPSLVYVILAYMRFEMDKTMKDVSAHMKYIFSLKGVKNVLSDGKAQQALKACCSFLMSGVSEVASSVGSAGQLLEYSSSLAGALQDAMGALLMESVPAQILGRGFFEESWPELSRRLSGNQAYQQLHRTMPGVNVRNFVWALWEQQIAALLVAVGDNEDSESAEPAPSGDGLVKKLRSAWSYLASAPRKGMITVVGLMALAGLLNEKTLKSMRGPDGEVSMWKAMVVFALGELGSGGRVGKYIASTVAGCAMAMASSALSVTPTVTIVAGIVTGQIYGAVTKWMKKATKSVAGGVIDHATGLGTYPAIKNVLKVFWKVSRSLTFKSHFDDSWMAYHCMARSQGGQLYQSNSDVVEEVTTHISNMAGDAVRLGDLFSLGVALHALEDAYAPGHVYRPGNDMLVRQFQSWHQQDQQKHEEYDSAWSLADNVKLMDAAVASGVVLCVYVFNCLIEMYRQSAELEHVDAIVHTAKRQVGDFVRHHVLKLADDELAHKLAGGPAPGFELPGNRDSAAVGGSGAGDGPSPSPRPFKKLKIQTMPLTVKNTY